MMIFSPLIPLSHSLALHLSTLAPRILRNKTTGNSWNFCSAAESLELWLTYESLVYSCLRTGDDQSAHSCLQKLTERFGADNERVMSLTGLYKEAVAKNNIELEKILREYESILQKDPTNIPISKRRIALFKSLERPVEAIHALNRLLEISPNDAENWAELSDLYIAQGMYRQAAFALEEALLVTPYAWNIHARLGEVLYMTGSTTHNGKERFIIEAVQCFCRSIELCDDYFRGYYGLKLVTDALQAHRNSENLSAKDKPLISKHTLERLQKLAFSKLLEISGKNAIDENVWLKCPGAESTSTKEMLGC